MNYAKKFYKGYQCGIKFAYECAYDAQVILKNNDYRGIKNDGDIERVLDLLRAAERYIIEAQTDAKYFEKEYGLMPYELNEEEKERFE